MLACMADRSVPACSTDEDFDADTSDKNQMRQAKKLGSHPGVGIPMFNQVQKLGLRPVPTYGGASIFHAASGPPLQWNAPDATLSMEREATMQR